MPKLKFSLIKDLRDLLDLYAEADSTIVKDRFHDLVCSAAFSDILFDLLDQNNDGHLDHHEITKTIEEKMGTTKDDDFTRFCAIFRDLISSYSGGYDVLTSEMFHKLWNAQSIDAVMFDAMCRKNSQAIKVDDGMMFLIFLTNPL